MKPNDTSEEGDGGVAWPPSKGAASGADAPSKSRRSGSRQDRITVPFCSDACEASARKFLEFDAKYSGLFYVVEAILALACLTLVFARQVFYAEIVAAGIGLLFLPFPFLAAVLGGVTYIKRSILLARVVGVLIIVAGGVAAAFI